MKKITWEAGHGYSGKDGAITLRKHGVRILRRKPPKPPDKKKPDEQRIYSVWVSDAQYNWAVTLLTTDRAPLVDPPNAQPLNEMPKSTWGVLPKSSGPIGWLYETFIEGSPPAARRRQRPDCRRPRTARR